MCFNPRLCFRSLSLQMNLLLLDRRPMSQWSTEAFLSLSFLLWAGPQTQTNLTHLPGHQFKVNKGEKLLMHH